MPVTPWGSWESILRDTSCPFLALACLSSVLAITCCSLNGGLSSQTKAACSRHSPLGKPATRPLTLSFTLLTAIHLKEKVKKDFRMQGRFEPVTI